MTALEVDQRITDLSQHPEAELETFFLAYGLGDAFNAPGKGWGRQKRVNAALTEANRQGRRDEVLEAASVRFAFQAADPPMAPVPLLPSLPVAELTDHSARSSCQGQLALDLSRSGSQPCGVGGGN
jgi:hypothetical protein